MFFIILTMEIIIRAAVEDEDFVLEDPLLTIIIVGVILAGIDTYFTLMYYKFLKQQELDLEMFENGSNGHRDLLKRQNVQSVTQPAKTTKVFVAVNRKSDSAPKSAAIASQPTYKVDSAGKNDSNDEVDLKQQNDAYEW